MDDAHDEVYEDRDKLLNIVEDDIDFCIYEQGVFDIWAHYAMTETRKL